MKHEHRHPHAHHGAVHAHHDHDNGHPGQDSAIDVVCGMTVSKDTPHRARHGEQEFYFCSEGCRKKFIADPEHFIHATARKSSTLDADVPAGTIYTCPMHPQVRQVGPGSCPICGMALEPLMPTDSEDDSALRSVKRKFRISAALSLPLVAIAMVPHLVDLHLAESTARVLRYLELALSAPVVFWAGLDYYRRGWQGVVSRTPNMYTLIGLGVLVAYAFSLFATFTPAAFPPEMRDAHGMVGVYFEVGAVIIALVLLGEWLELNARGKTSAAIRQLLGLAPKSARRIREDGTEEDVPLDQIQIEVGCERQQRTAAG